MSGNEMNSEKPDVYRVYLMRHAHAGAPSGGERDFDRRLDSRGRQEVDQVTRQAEAFGVVPQKIISSAASRCLETAKVVVQAHPDAVMEISDNLYSGSVETYCALICQNAGLASLMIVGHNPTIEELVEALIGRAAMAGTIPYGFPTAGLLCVEIDKPVIASAKLSAKVRFFITPTFSEAF